MTSRRNGLALLALIAFITTIVAAAWPLSAGSEYGAAAKPEGNERKIGEREEPAGIFEKESEQEPRLQKKRFPWLTVATGALALGLVVYFVILHKPKYTIEVSIGPGVDGTPAAGSYTEKKGKSLSYRFTPQTGYKNVKVLLDGKETGVEGRILFDGSHRLQASAEEIYQTLTVQVGDGISGTPATGTYTYCYGSRVEYGYSPVAGYVSPVILVDGVPAQAAGTLVMDRDHLLTASTTPETWDVIGTWTVVTTSVMGKGTKTYTAIFEGQNRMIISGVPGHYLMQDREISFFYSLGPEHGINFQGHLISAREMAGTFSENVGDSPPTTIDQGSMSATRQAATSPQRK